MLKTSLATLICAVAASSCSPTHSVRGSQRGASEEGVADSPPVEGRRPVRTPTELIGKPFDDALGRYGTATSDRILTIARGDRLYEYQNGLYPAVIDTLRSGTSAEVRQAAWEGDGQPEERAVWGVKRDGEWVIVHVLEWDKGVQF